MSDRDALLRSAIRAAIAAGSEILKVYESAFDVTLKEDRSPLTLADKNAHRVITRILEPTGLPVLSEEGQTIPYAERKLWNSFWMVDPLDGTKEFIRRNGEFTVNIALIENGNPVAGVILVPVTGVLYFGEPTHGSFRLDNGLSLLENTPEIELSRLRSAAERIPVRDSRRPFTVVASRSHLSPETSTFIDALRQEHGEVAFRSTGSSIKICLVAGGEAEVYPRLAPTMEWDTAAGDAIARSAGCRVTQWPTGNPLQYNKENLLNPFFVVTAP